MKQAIKYLIFLFVPVILLSCGSDDNNPYKEYTNFTSLTGHYDKGTRTIFINDKQIPFDSDLYAVYVTHSTNKILAAFLGFSTSDESRDIFDRNVEFFNFRSDAYGSLVLFDIRPNITYSALRGADIPQFIVNFYNSSMNVREMRNLNMQNTVGEYDVAQKELTFKTTGTFIVSDGSPSTEAKGKIEIIYKLKK